jgi:hypothetical protein
MILENKYWMAVFLFGLLLLVGCSPAAPDIPTQLPTVESQSIPTKTVQLAPEETAPEPAIKTATPTEEIIPKPTATMDVKTDDSNSQAEVLSVDMNGDPGDYSFSVKVSSPDEGCSQYADWWEVVSLDGELVYRRVLHHSHVDEQPFTRSGGPVPIEANTVVLVRVHMNTSGYSSLAMQGSQEQGFESIELGSDFAEKLSEMSPLPGDCGF